MHASISVDYSVKCNTHTLNHIALCFSSLKRSYYSLRADMVEKTAIRNQMFNKHSHANLMNSHDQVRQSD